MQYLHCIKIHCRRRRQEERIWRGGIATKHQNRPCLYVFEPNLGAEQFLCQQCNATLHSAMLHCTVQCNSCGRSVEYIALLCIKLQCSNSSMREESAEERLPQSISVQITDTEAGATGNKNTNQKPKDRCMIWQKYLKQFNQIWLLCQFWWIDIFALISVLNMIALAKDVSLIFLFELFLVKMFRSILTNFLTLVMAKFKQEIQSFFFFSEVVGRAGAICWGGIFPVFAHFYASRNLHKILNHKNRTWPVFQHIDWDDLPS